MESDEPKSSGRRKFIRQPEGRDEFNLAEFPLTLLADKIPSERKTIEWEDEITDRVLGQLVKRKVIVTGGDAYGLPTALDADVLFALIQLTKQVNNFTSRDVPFSRYELLRVLSWRDEGKSYRRIEESLNRWLGTSIYFSAWRDKESETWQTEKFHILDNVTLVTPGARKRLRARGRGDLAFSVVSWNRVVFRNLQAGFVCPVDLDVYFSLRRSVAKRIFRYLGKHFRLRQSEALSFDLKQFAFEKVGLSRSYHDAGQIKKELQPALEELEAAGFLKPMTREERYVKVAAGTWLISLARPDPVVGAAAAPPAAPAAEPAGAERSLIDRGVTPATAVELCRAFDDETVARQVAAFDWLVGRRDRRVSKSPAGYLVASIRKGYAAPEGYAAPRPAPPGSGPPGSGPPGPAVQGDEEEHKIRLHWDSLSPIEQEIQKNEAIRTGDAVLAGHYLRTRQTDPAVAAGYLRALLADHLRRAPGLGLSGPEPPPRPKARETADPGGAGPAHASPRARGAAEQTGPAATSDRPSP